MADRYNPVFKGGFWTKKMPTVDSTSSTSRVDNVHDLSPPRYTVQDKIWDAAKESLPSALPERPTVIAVMGPTGIGKSTFISKLASRERMLGCTQEIEEVPCKVGDSDVVLVDTMGFNDTERSDNDVLALLADWMKGS